MVTQNRKRFFEKKNVSHVLPEIVFSVGEFTTSAAARQHGAKTKTFGYHTCGEVKHKPKCCEHVRLCLTRFPKRLSGNTQVSVRTHELAL